MDTTIDTFERDVIERSRELPVVVDFWASWCGPCRMLGPALEAEAAKRAGLLELVKLDVEAEPLVAARYGIRSIPTVVVFRAGDAVNGFIGAYPAAGHRRLLRRASARGCALRRVRSREPSGSEMTPAIRHKEFRFPVAVAWDEGRLTTARVAGKQPLRIATPPEFRGTNPDVWSPEDAFMGAVASCLAVTIVAIAERDELPLTGLSVHAEGFVGRRADGRFGFVRIEQTVTLETDPDHEDAAREVVARAEDGCLVTASLDLPVQTIVDVRTTAGAG
jgi:thioredoxin